MSDLDALADGLLALAPPAVFGVPGSGPTLELADRLERAGVELVSTRHEATAALMAGTVGRLTGRAGVALAIKGPGLANMVPGLAACAFEGWPVLALAEAFGPEVPASRAHKRLDQPALVGAVAKGSRWLGAGPAALSAWAEAEVPGPVLLQLAAGPAGAIPAAPAATASDDAIVQAIRAAERPVVIAGTLAIRRGLSARLNALAVPVFSTAAAKGAVDERLPHAAGVFTGVGLERAPERALLARCDLIVGVGLRAGEVLGTALPAPAVNVDPVDAPGAAGFGFGASGDGTAWLDALADKAWGAEATAAAVGALDRHMLAGPFAPAHALAAVAGALGPDARLVIDTGYFCTIAEHAWKAPEAGLCLSSGAGRYMGIGLAQGLAAALHDPARPTVALAGDGGIGPYLGECDLAARRRLPLCVLFLTDGGYGSVRTRAIRDGLTQAPLTFAGPPWRRAFGGLGWRTERAGDGHALAALLAGWRWRDGPLFVEVPFDPDAYQAMVEGIR